MNWILILIGVVVVVFIIAKLSGEDTADAAGAAGAAGLYAGSCMVQIFIAFVSILAVIFIFGFLFG